MYNIEIPISNFSVRNQKIIKILRKEKIVLEQQKKKYLMDDMQYNYYIRREYHSSNVGHSCRPLNLIKKRLLPENRYKGYDLSLINENGNSLVMFD